jgi:hypothetical protein
MQAFGDAAAFHGAQLPNITEVWNGGIVQDVSNAQVLETLRYIINAIETKA